jgi:hypothetical protein
LIYPIYGTLVVGSSIAFKRAGRRMWRFTLGLAAFMSATLVPYVYIAAVISPFALTMPLWEHAWRLGFMLAVGTLVIGMPLVVGALIDVARGGPGARPEEPHAASREGRTQQEPPHVERLSEVGAA